MAQQSTLHSLETGLTGLFQQFKDMQTQFHADQKKQWDRQARREKLQALGQGLTLCDGEVSSQTRHYLYDLDLLVPRLENDNAGLLKVVKRTSSGPLRREILRYLDSQPEEHDDVPWTRLKAHIERTFLSADEDEKVRLVVERLIQRDGETLASYNRRYREAVQLAYPDPRSVDAERTVLRSYLKGLRSEELAKKVSLELKDQTLDAALEFVEKVEAGLERFTGLQRPTVEEPMDTSAVQVNPLEELLVAVNRMQKGQEKIATRLGKLEQAGGQSGGMPIKQGSSPTGQRGGPRKPVACFICGGPHFQVGCPQRHPRGPPQMSPNNPPPPMGN